MTPVAFLADVEISKGEKVFVALTSIKSFTLAAATLLKAGEQIWPQVLGASVWMHRLRFSMRIFLD